MSASSASCIRPNHEFLLFSFTDPELARIGLKMQYSMTQKAVYFAAETRLDRTAGVIRAARPDFEYQPLFPPEESGDAGRVRWVSGTPGKPPAYAGTDFIVARNGRIASVYLFFDKLP